MKVIPFAPPSLNEDDLLAVTEVLRSGWITSGKVGEKFSFDLSTMNKASFTLLTNSATAALFVALKTMGIGEGDEVITTPYTFAATANVIVHTGARVIFADVSPHSFYINPEEIYRKITPRTKAIIPVDFSTSCSHILDFSLTSQFFQARNPFQEALGRPLILSDSAHALGSRTLDDVDMAAYSFHAVKNLTTAEGGALSIKSFGDKDLDSELQRNLKMFILHGQSKNAQEKFAAGSWEYDITMAGYKFNMPDVLAALGYSQLKRYQSEILPHRRKLFLRYVELLKPYEQILMEESCIFEDIDHSSCHLVPIRMRDFSEEKRNQLIVYCQSQGVSTNVHYKPLTMMTVREVYHSDDPMPHCEAQYRNEISLPLHGGMTLDDVDYVVEVLLKGLKK